MSLRVATDGEGGFPVRLRRAPAVRQGGEQNRSEQNRKTRCTDPQAMRMCIQRQPAELLVGHDAPLGLHVSRESLFGTDPRLDPEGVLSVLRRVPRRVKRILDDLLSRKG